MLSYFKVIFFFQNIYTQNNENNFLTRVYEYVILLNSPKLIIWHYCIMVVIFCRCYWLKLLSQGSVTNRLYVYGDVGLN